MRNSVPGRDDQPLGEIGAERDFAPGGRCPPAPSSSLPASGQPPSTPLSSASWVRPSGATIVARGGALFDDAAERFERGFLVGVASRWATTAPGRRRAARGRGRRWRGRSPSRGWAPRRWRRPKSRGTATAGRARASRRANRAMPAAAPASFGDPAVDHPHGAAGPRGDGRVVGDDQQPGAAAQARSNSRSMMAAPVAPSRLPVGSSASSSSGRGAVARAMATRCCSPPDSCAG